MSCLSEPSQTSVNRSNLLWEFRKTPNYIHSTASLSLFPSGKALASFRAKNNLWSELSVWQSRTWPNTEFLLEWVWKVHHRSSPFIWCSGWDYISKHTAVVLQSGSKCLITNTSETKAGALRGTVMPCGVRSFWAINTFTITKYWQWRQRVLRWKPFLLSSFSSEGLKICTFCSTPCSNQCTELDWRPGNSLHWAALSLSAPQVLPTPQLVWTVLLRVKTKGSDKKTLE